MGDRLGLPMGTQRHMTNRFQRQTRSGDDHSHDAYGQGSENDPLAELARLIGQTAPQSNFSRANPVAVNARGTRTQPAEADVGEESGPAPLSWMRTAAVGHDHAGQQVEHDQPAHIASAWSSQFQHDDAPTLSSTPSFLAHGRQTADHHQEDGSRYDHVLYGQQQQSYAQQPVYAQHDDASPADDYEAYAPPPLKKKRSSLVTVGAVVALGVIGTASAFAYRTYGGSHRSGEPPIIKAETGAIKVVPPTAEGSNKLINDRIATGEPARERIVPREEKPIDVTSGTAPRVVFPPLNQQVTGSAPTPPATAVRQANGAMQDEPRRVRTVPVRSDQPDTAPVQRPTAAPASPAPIAAAPPPPAPRTTTPAPSANAPMSLSPQASAGPIRTAAAPPAMASGSYLVQIASQRSEADALASYRVAQSKFPGLLGSRNPIIRKADLGEKGMYYRALVGPFASADEASQLCGSMRSAGGQCVIHRN